MTWLPVLGWEDRYEVSDDNEGVRSLLTGELLKPEIRNGYVRYHLCRDKKQTIRSAHSLVLEAFVGPRPEGQEGRHFPDPDKTNNHVSNLSWATRSQNTLDKVTHGQHFWANKTHCPRRHEYTPENTYRSPDGGRKCRACRRERR